MTASSRDGSDEAVTRLPIEHGVALSVATPGPFMLFTAFVGFLAGGVFGAVIATFFVFCRPSYLLSVVRCFQQPFHSIVSCGCQRGCSWNNTGRFDRARASCAF